MIKVVPFSMVHSLTLVDAECILEYSTQEMPLRLARGKCLFSIRLDHSLYQIETLLFWLNRLPTILISLGSHEEHTANRSLEKRAGR